MDFLGVEEKEDIVRKRLRQDATGSLKICNFLESRNVYFCGLKGH
jgi:hypothetical protein